MQKRLYMKEGTVGGRHPSVVVISFIVLFIVVATLVGLYLLGANTRNADIKRQIPDNRLKVSVSVSPTVLPSVAASPSATVVPSLILDRSVLRIRVLNGSGLPGAASGISSYLSGLGYTVVSVGNADSYIYRNITVLVQTRKSSYAQLLKKDLQEKSSSVSASLSDDITGDAEVIVGR